MRNARRYAAVGGLCLLALALLYLRGSGAVAMPPPEVLPATEPVATVAAAPRVLPAQHSAPAAPAPTNRIRCTAQTEREVRAFAATYVDAFKRTDRDALRRHISGDALLAEGIAELKAHPPPGKFIVPEATKEERDRFLDTSINTLLQRPAEERADWASKAAITDIDDLGDGRVYLRFAATILAAPPLGHDIDGTGRVYGPGTKLPFYWAQRMILDDESGSLQVVSWAPNGNPLD